MTRVAIFIRSGHQLDQDVQVALARLSAAGIRATEETTAELRWSRRFVWVQKDEQTDLATTLLRATGIRCC
jgi:hypothetical protein